MQNSSILSAFYLVLSFQNSPLEEPFSIFKKSIIEFSEIILLFAVGAFGGFLSGLLGIGGGVIYVAIFSHFIAQFTEGILSDADQVKLVLAHASLAKLFAAFSGSVQQYLHKNFWWKPSLAISLPAIIVSLGFSEMLRHIHFSKTTFSLIFIALFVPMLLRMLFQKSETKKRVLLQSRTAKNTFMSLVGVASGMVAAVSGLGGGFIMVPLMSSFLQLKIRKIVSISLGAILMTSLALSIYYFIRYDFPTAPLPYMYGAISFGLAIPALCGVLLFPPLGVRAAQKLSPFQIRLIFIFVCFAVIAKMLYSLL